VDLKRDAIRKPDTPRNGPDTSSGSLVTHFLLPQVIYAVSTRC
jgi:hypothetical protein